MDTTIDTARLLRGEKITRNWTRLELPVEDRGRIPLNEDEHAILYHTKLIAQVGNQEIDTGYVKQTVCKSARIASVHEKENATAAGYATLVPGSIPEAVLSAVPMSQFEDSSE